MSETTFEVVLLRKINRFPCIDVAREKKPRGNGTVIFLVTCKLVTN